MTVHKCQPSWSTNCFRRSYCAEGYNDGTAQTMLEHDLKMEWKLNIRTLPAYMIQYRNMYHERIITQHLQHTQLQVLVFVRLSKDLKNGCAKCLSQFFISRGNNNRSVFQVLVRNAHWWPPAKIERLCNRIKLPRCPWRNLRSVLLW